MAAESSRRWGRAAGIGAGWALLAMPRVFAHAHLAALDTFLSLFWTLALLAGVRATAPLASTRTIIGAGALWSLALLTKIHAWLLLPILALWAFTRLSWQRACRTMAVWTWTGVALFLAGWPWLWYDTWARWISYWGTSVQRATIMVEYFGQVMPIGTCPGIIPGSTSPSRCRSACSSGSLWACRGLAHRRVDRFPWLLAATIVVFLGLFSTRIPVYDGERLFLHVFPAWAMLIGLGFGRLWQRWGTIRPGALFVGRLSGRAGFWHLGPAPIRAELLQSPDRRTAGAERLGLELTYWSDAVDRVLLDRLAAETPRCIGGPGPDALSGAGDPHDHRRPGPARDHPSG